MDLRGANLCVAPILHTDLSGAMLHRPSLPGVYFADVDLSDAFFSGADLSKAQFRDVDFRDLEEIRAWMIEYLTGFRTTFRPYLEDILARMEGSGDGGEHRQN